MIIGKTKGITVQVKKQGTPGTQSLTIHGQTTTEVYNKIYFLFKAEEETQGDVHLTMYKTKKRIEEQEDERTNQ